MAKKKCKDPRCMPCNWWPKITKLLGKKQGCYWVDEGTGEVFIATGLRANPDGQLTAVSDEEGSSFWASHCDCGGECIAREDLLHRGLMTRCPQCATALAHAMRN